MGGAFAHLAEVVAGLDEAAAEVALPDAVDHHAGGERVLRIGDPAGQGEAAAGGGRREGRLRRSAELADKELGWTARFGYPEMVRSAWETWQEIAARQ